MTDDDKPPVLPAEALLAVIDDMIEDEQLISQRVQMKEFMKKVRSNMDVMTILSVEKEVGREVFNYAIHIVNLAAQKEINSVIDQQEDILGLNALRGLLLDSVRLADIRPPYRDEEF